MNITKGQFCQFSLKSRLQMLMEFGNYICQNVIGNRSVVLYVMHGFHVEVIYNTKTKRVERIEPVTNLEFVAFYKQIGNVSRLNG